MNVPDHLIKIGRFAKLAGTNLRTLRYYEERELIVPTYRSEGGFRYYRPTDVNRVRLVRDLQDLGLNLDKIRELLGGRQATLNPTEFLQRIRAALAEHERLIVAKMEALETQRRKLEQATAKLTSCSKCNCIPTVENNYCEPCSDGNSLPEILSALF